MDRKEFLLTIGKGAAVAGLVYCAGCSQNSYVPTAPSNVDFTIDLTQAANQPLTSVGGSIVTDNGIIIGRTGASSFVAVSSACTHQGTTIQFQLNNNRFYCPNHGSTYSLDGKVTNGPAEVALSKYNTSFNGTNLRVYS
jgi:cytochrome b6-f complex iron-sulfur subunit